jgi:UDP-N-acetyl-D-mannosaminuronate dehydrogenase
VPELPAHEPYNWNLSGTALTAEVLKQSDCVVVTTDHTAIDYNFVAEHAQLIVDTRNACKSVDASYRYKITRI